jgi:tRNA 2-selenouridine synthase
MANPHRVEGADPATLARFDALIDVRSPAEFAEDHAPGAINLPVLGDDERAVVGTMYVQDSRFRARRLGAALVARNIARHLETALADQPHDFKPLIYCWRGGQRSNAMATVLAQVGWSTAVLVGGYRTYRRRVQTRLYDAPLGLHLILLDGGTGSGKTEVLQALPTRGMQVIDLEALAEHRGSLFGAAPGSVQPSQKLFETRLLAAIEALDPACPVVVEAESHKIGERMLPPALWRAMAVAPRIELMASAAARAERLVELYADLIATPDAVRDLIARLPVHLGKAPREVLTGLLDAGDFGALAEALITLHYDPAYERSSRRDARERLAQVALDTLDASAIEAASDAVAQRVAAQSNNHTGEGDVLDAPS